MEDCTLALSIIDGLIAVADETRSGIYASTQTLFAPWEDSRVVANAELDTTVTLDWLYDDDTHTGNGRNTLYVCMQGRSSILFRIRTTYEDPCRRLYLPVGEKLERIKPAPHVDQYDGGPCGR